MSDDVGGGGDEKDLLEGRPSSIPAFNEKSNETPERSCTGVQTKRMNLLLFLRMFFSSFSHKKEKTVLH
jgi:hypothetical protein